MSGFLDWPRSPSEAVGYEEWRCRENPSGYLFIGRWYDPKSEAPSKQDPSLGPLPRRLTRIHATRDGRAIDWTFDLLPVRWGVARRVAATDYDVVVNLGLGVYSDRFGADFETTLLLEDGARNRRSSAPDVDGNSVGVRGSPDATIDRNNSMDTLPAPPHIRQRAGSLAGAIKVGGVTFTVIHDPARDTNAFVCNETHYTMLAQADLRRRLRQAYFIHIPRPSNMRGGRLLASALAELIAGLIQP